MRNLTQEISAMKTSTLLIALGLASSTALAQMPSPSPSQPDSSTQSPSSGSGASGSRPGAQSGDQSDSQSGPSSGTSGTQSDSRYGMPPSPGSGASGAPAGQSSSAAGSEPSPLSRLQPKTENGVTYLCGGVGEEEASYLKREARNHDMMLTFATQRGEYLADVNVDIKDARGQSVLQTSCDGPIMLVDLPKGGTYRIRADAQGYTLNKTVSVQHGKGGHKVAMAVLTWPERVAKGPESSSTQSGGGTSGTSGGGAGRSDSRGAR
jgi:hypothetical protein